MSSATKVPHDHLFRMPAEWEPHVSTWIAWPHNESDWPGKFEPIPWVYAEIVRHLAGAERVNIIVQDRELEAAARKILKRANVPLANVYFHRWPTDRVWTRDSGPIFVKTAKDGERVVLNWQFNAWAKYSNWKNDNELPHLISCKLGLEEVAPAITTEGDHLQPLVLEGGSIDVNGRGTMLTTEECLLSRVQQRNPSVTREEFETIFSALLGVRKVIWLGNGIAGDDTHGHIDDLARFVAPDTVVTAVERDPADINYAPLQDNCKRLRSATDQDGRRLKVIELPMPSPVIFAGRRLPASYANFYIANGLVLMPTFNDHNDRVALNTLAELFPKRKVVGIYCGDFIWGFGAIHCMTQQEPR
ncbi:MAG TPA: agmatine deiminase family protein [Terriglobales bacterium]|nr:agmatine deiminase family protein [Terriglobales bacterium]